jgi:thiamine biosynthesis lipoprotein
MGTVVSFYVVLRGEVTSIEARSLVAEACRLLHHHDEVFSTWRADSPLSRVRRGEMDLADAPPEIPEVLALCASAKACSRDWFDPWALPGGVDPTGLVKGWALEQAVSVLERGGIRTALLNAGGDLAALGRPAPERDWRIGIRHPWRADALACIMRLDAAMATSGTYERGAHLIDPRTGRPGTRAASATVCGPSLAMADALATALAVGGDDVLGAIGALGDYEGYLIRMDGSEAWTDGIVFVD